jgi:hypothetical protein
MGLFYLMIGVGIAVAIWFLLRTLADAPPKKIVAGAKIAGAGLGVVGAVFLLLTGRLWSVLALGSTFAPVLARWFSGWRIGQGASAQTASDGDSSVETRLLRMTLDHATGAMDGVVREGARRGRRLSELDMAALLDLLAHARLDDPDSAPLLEAYLDRAYPEWRAGPADESAAPPPPRGGAAMDRAEAARLLGVPVGADADTVKAAHRRLMMKVHPDHGGTDYLAARLNDAKRVLLGE